MRLAACFVFFFFFSPLGHVDAESLVQEMKEMARSSRASSRLSWPRVLHPLYYLRRPRRLFILLGFFLATTFLLWNQHKLPVLQQQQQQQVIYLCKLRESFSFCFSLFFVLFFFPSNFCFQGFGSDNESSNSFFLSANLVIIVSLFFLFSNFAEVDIRAN